MNLTSYAELAVTLVNSDSAGEDGDGLRSLDDLRVFLSRQPQLSGPVTHHDLDALRLLRTELADIFTAAAAGRDARVAERMNALLARQPIHPVIVYHDEPRWHVHLTESGSVADRYAAGAVIGLTLLVAQHGIRRLGCCAIASCSGVFLDASPNGSRRYCAEHSATRSNVTAIRSEHGNSGAGGADAAAS